MTRQHVGRALVLLLLLGAMQPLLMCACVALTPDHFAPPAQRETALFSFDERDDDEVLADVFGGDPVLTTCALPLPVPEPRTEVAPPEPLRIPPRVPDPAEHPPRLV